MIGAFVQYIAEESRRLGLTKVFFFSREIYQNSPFFVLIAECLRKAGAARYLKDIDCSRERARKAVLHQHEIRSRFTIVDLAWMVGVLPDAADDLIDEWLVGDS